MRQHPVSGHNQQNTGPVPTPPKRSEQDEQESSDGVQSLLIASCVTPAAASREQEGAIKMGNTHHSSVEVISHV